MQKKYRVIVLDPDGKEIRAIEPQPVAKTNREARQWAVHQGLEKFIIKRI